MKITPEQIAELRRRTDVALLNDSEGGVILAVYQCETIKALLDDYALLCEVADAVIASRMEAHDFTDRLDRAIDALRKARAMTLAQLEIER